MNYSRVCFAIITALFLLVLTASTIYSADFIDTFDDPSFTNSNWTTYTTGTQQTWNHTMLTETDYGYHASTIETNPPAAKLAGNATEYNNAGLIIEAIVRIDSHPDMYTSENKAGVAFSLSRNTGYGAGIQLDFDGQTEILFSLGNIEGDTITEMPVNISFDTFYKIVVQISSAQRITARLFASDGTLMGSLSTDDFLSFNKGGVAIYGAPEVTFNSFKINPSTADPSGRLTTIQVSQLYVAIFNRASEGEGNAYWQSQPDMVTAATAMLDTQAAKDYFGTSLNTNQAFIEHIYQNTLNKTMVDDPGGIAYWTGLLEDGTSRGEVVAALVGVIQDYAPGGPYYNPDDAATVVAYQQFTNRVTVCDYLADTLWSPPPDWNEATQFSSTGLNVTSESATVINAQYAIDSMNQMYNSAPWPMHRHDAKNTGRSPYAGPSSPKEKWRFILPATVTDASPVVGTDGTIYIGNGQSGFGGIFAVNPDGSQKWLYPGHSGNCAPALSSDDTIYMPGYLGLHAVNPDGSVKWTYRTQETRNYSSPCIGPDGTIYVVSGIDLLALSPDGQLLWQYRVGESINSKPAVATNGTVFVRSGTDYLCAINTDGTERWRLELGSRPYGCGLSPVIADDGTIYTNGIAPYTRTDSDHTIDVNSLYAINPDGTTKWIFNAISPAGGNGGFEPALDAAGNLYLGGKVNDLWSTNAIFSLDSFGNLLWTYELPLTDYIGKSSPLLDVNGVIYFGATNNLYALTPQGSLKWTLETKIRGSSLAMGPDGTLYYGTEDGYLNAVGSK